jgi:hypothetical protein
MCEPSEPNFSKQSLRSKTIPARIRNQRHLQPIAKAQPAADHHLASPRLAPSSFRAWT